MPAVGATVGDNDWADYTYEEASKFTQAHGFLTYGKQAVPSVSDPALTCTSVAAEKTLAERAAWDFVAKEKPTFTLTTYVGYSRDTLLNFADFTLSYQGLSRRCFRL